MKLLGVSVTTISPYTRAWNVTAPVGGSRTRLFEIHLAQGDLGVDKLLTVRFDNNGDGIVDGAHVITFRVNGTHDITDYSASPTSGTIFVGSTRGV